MMKRRDNGKNEVKKVKQIQKWAKDCAWGNYWHFTGGGQKHHFRREKEEKWLSDVFNCVGSM
jgi:hypothetical protein